MEDILPVTFSSGKNHWEMVTVESNLTLWMRWTKGEDIWTLVESFRYRILIWSRWSLLSYFAICDWKPSFWQKTMRCISWFLKSLSLVKSEQRLVGGSTVLYQEEDCWMRMVLCKWLASGRCWACTFITSGLIFPFLLVGVWLEEF